MTTHPLPDDPDLEQLRTRARELQRGVRAGDDWALDLTAEHHPDGPVDPGDRPGWKLSAAQRTLARIHGFASWPALVRYLAVVAVHRRAPDEVGPQQDPAAEFLRLACLTYGGDDPARFAAARELLAAHPDLARDDVRVAAACCDVPELRRLLAADPGLAAREGGPHAWAPLAYLAYARHDPDLSEDAVVASARLLLDAGADPDTGYLWHGLPSPFTVLTGAFGEGEGGPRLQPPHPHGPALARVLLEAGADPNDAQTLYNRMFRRADDHLVLLFEFGLGRGDGGPWKRRLGREAMDPPEMLLGQLAWAVVHGFDTRVRLLAEHGVDLEAPLRDFGGEGLPAHGTALRAGQLATAELLRRLGAVAVPLPAEDQVLAAVLAGDGTAVERLGPEALARAREARPGLVVWAAARGDVTAVRLAVGLGWDASARARTDVPSDHPWETALHQAAQAGDVELARVLLELGADPEVRDARFDATPLMWAGYFGQDAVVEVLGG